MGPGSGVNAGSTMLLRADGVLDYCTLCDPISMRHHQLRTTVPKMLKGAPAV